MKLITVGQVWSSDLKPQYVCVITKIEGRKIWASQIHLPTATKVKQVVLAYGSNFTDGQTYTNDLYDWKLVIGGTILDQIKRMEWADKYL